MNSNLYIILALGIIFVSIGAWLWKKDRQQFKILEDRLAQKERDIYELYESLEQLMEDIDKLYRTSLPDDIIKEDFPHHEKQEYDETIRAKNEIQDNRNENQEKDIEIKEDEENIENVIFKLKNEGVSEEDIAKQLGMGIGEVKLILELKNDRGKWT